jgi:arylsulfatase A-like enzyme
VHTYATTQTVDDAIGWMDTMNTNKPFFLWLAFNAPHSPFHLPPATLCNTTGLSGTTADISANPKNYFKVAIEAMDTEIGRLFQYLNTNNLMDSTNIIFIGDNGNEAQVAQITNPNKSKGTLYDYGVHVPMIIAGPSVVNPNRTSDALVNTHDLFATIAEWSGFTNWRNYIPSGKIVDSKSIMPIIKNQSTSTRTWIFTEQFAVPTATVDGKTIRNTDYHLMRLDNGLEEFYNITLDPFENTNLINTMSMTDIANYNALCDTLHTLINSVSCSTTGLINRDIINKMNVYPNPFSNYIMVDEELTLHELELIDYQGRVVFSGNGINTINFSELPRGLYLLKDKSQYNQSIKLIKE